MEVPRVQRDESNVWHGDHYMCEDRMLYARAVGDSSRSSCLWML
jgi:hypothetical protein